MYIYSRYVCVCVCMQPHYRVDAYGDVCVRSKATLLPIANYIIYCMISEAN